MPLSLHYHRVDVAAFSGICISGSDATRVPVYYQYSVPAGPDIPAASPLLLALRTIALFISQRESNRCFVARPSTLIEFQSFLSMSCRSLASPPLWERRSVADASGLPMVYGTITSCHLRFSAPAVAVSMLWCYFYFFLVSSSFEYKCEHGREVCRARGGMCPPDFLRLM